MQGQLPQIINKSATMLIRGFFKDAFLLLGLTVFLVIAGHFVIGGVNYIKSWINPDAQHLTTALEKSPVFLGYSNYEDYFKEVSASNRIKVNPYYHWRREPYVGKAIEIDQEGRRKTIKSPALAAKKVFMFGGSTMWGTGSPNPYTIPSQLQALLGPHYDVYNFGETNFVAVQELNLLLEQLSKGFIPDTVIFYDGVNDTYASLYAPGKIRHPFFKEDDYQNKSEITYLLAKLWEKTNYSLLVQNIKSWLNRPAEIPTLDLQQLEDKAQETMRQYAHFMKQVKALGEVYGFKVYHFWQPLLLIDNKVLSEQEQKIYQENRILTHPYNAIYKIAKEMHGKDNFYYLGHIFEKIEDPIYFDFCHVGPKGNSIIAEHMKEIAFSNS